MIRVTVTLITLISRGLFLILAIVGVVGVAPIALQQYSAASSCPSLGQLPACYIVLIGYLTLVLSALLSAMRQLLLFIAGWLPLFALAATGTVLELSGVAACPDTSGGNPACFWSLGLLAVLTVLFSIDRKFRGDHRPSN